jgi:3-isopropylmalate/(R)-2-methylmalate dehydratase large subunit
MGQTFAQKVLARNVDRREVAVGEILQVKPDVALSHDNSAPIYAIFQEMGGKTLADPERLAVFLDHAAPAPTTKHAENHRVIRDFVGEQDVTHFFDVGRGICHQVLVEEGLALPGEVVLGADSHTPHAGVMGAFAAGIGRSEMASVWALGELWLRVPQSLKVLVDSPLPEHVTAKDLALHVIGALGADGGLYSSVEWHGEAVARLHLSERAVLTNMAAEMGAKNSYIPPDEAVYEYLEGRAQRRFEPVFPDPDALYEQEFEVDAGSLEPMIACPHTVDNVRPISEVQGRPVQQAFLGTCTNGRLEDLAAAAGILRGRHIAPGTRTIIIPASAQVYMQALQAGYLKIFLQAGAVVESPGCGPCMGNHLGIPAPGETTISSANRNFRGRMGTAESDIYLASPAVVAASAVTGAITHPKDL